MERKNIPAVTSLRFFAALAVIIQHYDDKKNALFPIWATGYGYWAVTFFFILSGFILTYVHFIEKSPHGSALNVSDRSFFTSRAARILPVYALALTIAAPFFLYTYFVSHVHDFQYFALALVFVPLLAQAWIPLIATAWSGPCWSLSVEWFFYLIFPSILRSAGRHSTLQLLAIAGIAVTATHILREALIDAGPAGNLTWAAFVDCFPLFHVAQFFLGIALAVAFIRSQRMPQGRADVLFAAAMIIQSLAVYFTPQYPWLATNVPLCLTFGLLIFSAARASGPIASLISARPLVFLGEASYAIYLLHWPLFMWWYRLSKKELGLTLSPVWDFGVYFCLVLFVSCFTYVFFEKSAKAWVLREFGNPK